MSIPRENGMEGSNAAESKYKIMQHEKYPNSVSFYCFCKCYPYIIPVIINDPVTKVSMQDISYLCHKIKFVAQ